MAQQRMPTGFRFHPTDEELVAYYLKGKVLGRPIADVIAEVDLYKCEPWDLPDRALPPNNDKEWYFFSARDKKYPNGGRTNRATPKGYWKTTGKDRDVQSGKRTIGLKKTLVYYQGRAPKGERTDWVMHEYRLEDELNKSMQGAQDAFVVVRIFKKSGPGPRNGEQYGADLSEEAEDPAPPPESCHDPPVDDNPTKEGTTSLKLEVVVKSEPVDVNRQVIAFKGVSGVEMQLAKVNSEELQVVPVESTVARHADTQLLEIGNGGNVPLVATTHFPDLPSSPGLDELLNSFGNQGPGDDADAFWPHIMERASSAEESFGDSEGDEDWRELVVDNMETLLVEYSLNEEVCGGQLPLMMDSVYDAGSPAVFGDYLEMNDLAPLAGQNTFSSTNDDIQLRPRPGALRMMPNVSQGQASRRIFMSLHETSHSQIKERDCKDLCPSTESVGRTALRPAHVAFERPGSEGVGQTSGERVVGSSGHWNVPEVPGVTSLCFSTWMDAGLQVPSLLCTQYNGNNDFRESILSGHNFQEDDCPARMSLQSSEQSIGLLLSPSDLPHVNAIPETGGALPGLVLPTTADSNEDISDQPSVFSSAIPRTTEKLGGTSNKEASKVPGIYSLISAMSILPASVAELRHSSMGVKATNTQVTAGSINCIHAGDGVKHLEATLTYQTGGKVHRKEISEILNVRTEDSKYQRYGNCKRGKGPQRKVPKGSSSGFVFVLFLGAAPALFWFFVVRAFWRTAHHTLKAIL